VKVVNTLAKHRQEPYIQYGPYVQSVHITLGEQIRPLCKVYLDTNFWVWLRNVRLGCNTNPDHISLLGKLEALVAAKAAVCPLSTEIFREVFGQSDIRTLTATVELIDQLSQGICLVEHEQRVHTEAFHFLRQTTLGSDALHPLENMVWTRAAYVLGKVTPTFDSVSVDGATQLANQKAFFDHMWGLSLSDILAELGESAATWTPTMPDLSQQLNEGKFANVGDYKSFKQLLLIELRGVLDCYQDVFANVIHQFYEHHTGYAVTDDEKASDSSGATIASIMYECFRQGKITREVPTIRVAANLHAGMRWDANRKYKAHDSADIRHACAAVPYCDFFLTERSLCHLVADKNLQFDTIFPCKAYSDAASAREALAQIGI
jgi:hypothetical protein